jgi:hypothetical protein
MLPSFLSKVLIRDKSEVTILWEIIAQKRLALMDQGKRMNMEMTDRARFDGGV